MQSLFSCLLRKQPIDIAIESSARSNRVDRLISGWTPKGQRQLQNPEHLEQAEHDQPNPHLIEGESAPHHPPPLPSSPPSTLRRRCSPPAIPNGQLSHGARTRRRAVRYPASAPHRLLR